MNYLYIYVYAFYIANEPNSKKSLYNQFATNHVT